MRLDSRCNNQSATKVEEERSSENMREREVVGEVQRRFEKGRFPFW